jgi:hypothetical protein
VTSLKYEKQYWNLVEQMKSEKKNLKLRKYKQSRINTVFFFFFFFFFFKKIYKKKFLKQKVGKKKKAGVHWS